MADEVNRRQPAHETHSPESTDHQGESSGLDSGAWISAMAEALATAGGAFEKSPSTGVALLKQLLSRAPDDPVTQAPALVLLGTLLRRVGETTADIAALDEAVRVGRAAVDGLPLLHPWRASAGGELVNTLLSRFDAAGNRRDVEAAVAAAEAALVDAPASPLPRHMFLTTLALAYFRRAGHAGVADELDRAIRVSRDAVAYPDATAVAWGNLAVALAQRSELSGGVADLDEAISIFRSAFERFGKNGLPQSIVIDCANSLRTRAQRTGSLADATDAVHVLTSSGIAAGVSFHSALCGALTAARRGPGGSADTDPPEPRHSGTGADRAGESGDLPVKPSRRSASPHPSGVGERGVAQRMWKSVLAGFGVATTNAAIRAGDVRLLSRGTAALESALARTSPQHRRFPFLAAALSTALRERYQHQHAPADLERALELIRQAAAAAPLGHPQYGWIQTSLARTLTRHAVDTRSAAELDDAVEAGRRGVEALTAASHDQAERHTVLGIALKTRYDVNGSGEDLAESIMHIRAAQDGQPRHQADKDTVAANAAFSYVESFRRYGRPGDLDAVIENLDPAARSPSEVAQRLSRALAARARAIGEPGDLDESITLGALAADLAPPGNPRWDALLWLGQVLTIRYEDRGNPADIDQAVEHLRSALPHIDERDLGRSVYLESLGHALWARYEGGAGSTEDVEASVRVLQDAVARTPSHDAGTAGLSANLAAALWTRYGITQDPRDLDAVIDHGEAALKSSAPGHDDRTRLLLNLGIGHKSRFDARGEPQDALRAIALWQEAAQFADIRVGMRIGAASNWGELATRIGDIPSALAAYDTAIKMLPHIAWRGLSATGQQQMLGRWSGLATEAASAALNAGDAGKAVELMETGRGISWEHALALRASLSALQDYSPELANRIASIWEAMVAVQA